MKKTVQTPSPHSIWRKDRSKSPQTSLNDTFFTGEETFEIENTGFHPREFWSQNEEEEQNMGEIRNVNETLEDIDWSIEELTEIVQYNPN